MNKLILNSATIFLFGVFAISSCKMQKDAAPVPQKESTQTEVEKFFENNDVETQQFTVSSSTSTTIVATEGTKITIPSNAFKDANGNPVTGNVTLNVQEIFDQSDMIFAGVTTQSDSTLLISGGEIFIGATANGQNVYLNESSTIQVNVPIDGAPDPNMNLFVGQTDNSGTVNWVPVDTSQNSSVQVRQDSTGTGSFSYYYSFTSDRIGWINCDYFYNQTNTTLTVNLPSLDALAGKELSGANVFVVYKNINSVARLYNTITCQATSCPALAYSGLSGLGQDVIVITVADIDGKLHYNKQDITISANHIISLSVSDLTEVSDSELQSIIESL